MPRTIVTPRAVTVGHPTLPVPVNSLDLTEVAADIVNKNRVVHTGKEVIVAHNTDVGAVTVTITSVPVHGRSGDVTAYSLGAGEIALFGPYPTTGWRQTDGYLYFEASDVDCKFAVLKLP
jgi:hypothetical protein